MKVSGIMSSMSQSNSRRSLRWALPVLIGAATLIAILLGIQLYVYSLSPPVYSVPHLWFGWWFPFGWFFFIPVFFLVFFALRWFVWGGWCWGRGWGYGGYYFDSPLETLRQRFAKGEITKEQYDDMMRKLSEK